MLGGPIDLTPFGGLVKSLSLIYWLVALAVTVAVMWFPRRWIVKLLLGAAVHAVFAVPAMRLAQQRNAEVLQARAASDVAKERLALRCKEAGTRIHRTVDNVDSIVWPVWRPKEHNTNDQFMLSDPYGHDCSGTECIKQLLRVTRGQDLDPYVAKLHQHGYAYVETIDPENGQKYRYVKVIGVTLTRKPHEMGRYDLPVVYGAILERTPIDAFTSPYAVVWEDVSMREDREQWIAGGALRVIVRSSDEVIAEHVGFLREPGRGNSQGFRNAWGWAQAYGPRCSVERHTTQGFAMRVLKPADAHADGENEK